MQLNYFSGDFKRTTGKGASFSSSNALTSGLPVTASLYNGNISSWLSQTDVPAGSGLQHQNKLTAYTYKYDELNRLKQAVFNIHGSSGWTASSDYNSYYEYDANGNLEYLKRTAYGTGAMDSLTYHYDKGSSNTNPKTNNLLYHYTDNGTDNNYDDLKPLTNGYDASAPATGNNFGYDAIGNLVRDNSEHISSIQWRADGKVAAVIHNGGSNEGPDLEFSYDALGNRIAKRVRPKDSSGNLQASINDDWTYYVRDASGQVMGIYTLKEVPTASGTSGSATIIGGSSSNIVAGATTTQGGSSNVATVATSNRQLVLSLAELPLYGSSSLGQCKPNLVMKSYTYDSNGNLLGAIFTLNPTGSTFTRSVGEKYFALDDHLGNVRAVITDVKHPLTFSGTGQPTTFDATVDVVNNYYAFGMLQPGRGLTGGGYRYGFNGMEKDDEIKGQGNSYTTLYRQNDPRLGRWMSIDPKAAQLPWQSPYNSMDNNPIIYNDPLGDWVRGEGFWRNVFNTDDKINAQNRAEEMGGVASKVDGTWRATWLETNTVDLGNGAIDFNVFAFQEFKGTDSKGNEFASAVTHIEDGIDDFMKNLSFLHKADAFFRKGNTGHNAINKIVNRAPPINLINNSKIALTGESLFGEDKSTTTDRVVGAIGIVGSLATNASLAIRSLDAKPFIKMLRNINGAVQFHNAAGLFDSHNIPSSDFEQETAPADNTRIVTPTPIF